MIEILKELCNIPTAPGMEKGILDYIEEKYAKNTEYYLDGIGNLTVAKKCGKKDAKKIMLCAGADSDGFIVNYIEENGYLRVTKLGVPNMVSCAFTQLVSEKGVCGFIVPEKDGEVKESDTSKLYVDIGAKSREEAEKLVTLGDIFARIPTFTELCTTRVGGSCTASRTPVAILADILANTDLDNVDLYFSFTVQKSLMHRGAKTAAFDIQPDFCICIDTCESFDRIGANKRGEAVLGDGAVILAKTSDFCLNPDKRTLAENIAKDKNIKYKTCVYIDKTTAASLVTSCGKGVEAMTIALPVRSIGSGAEVFDIADAENAKKLVLEMVKSF